MRAICASAAASCNYVTIIHVTNNSNRVYYVIFLRQKKREKDMRWKNCTKCISFAWDAGSVVSGWRGPWRQTMNLIRKKLRSKMYAK